MSGAWTPGPIELRIVHPVCRVTVSGWSDGTFGINRRAYENDNFELRVVHTITHLRTGGVVRHVKGSLSNAKKIARLLHAAPWDFDAVEDCSKEGRKEAVKKAVATGLCVDSFNVLPSDEMLRAIAAQGGSDG